MPLPPDYIGTQDDDRTRSVDNLHIQPSIMEGRFLNPSLYGPEATIPLHRYPPSNITPPSIVGDRIIPATLEVDTGQWDASPSAQFAYQWMSEGVDIPGATSKTWLSELTYDDTDITVEVRGFNRKGEAYVLTPVLHITRIEPIEILEGDFAVITGIQSQGEITQFGDRTMVITGLGAENVQTVVRSVSYYVTGRAADERLDTNSTYYYVLNGLPIEDNVLHQNADISVINYDWGTPLVDSVSQPIRLINNDAEMGTLAWDVQGTITTITANPHNGERYFYGGDDANTLNIPYSYMTQEVVLDPEWLVDVDAATCFVELNWMQRSHSRSDQANIFMEFYGASDNFLGKTNGPGLWGATTTWFFRKHDETPIPSGTRKIRYIVEFNLVAGDNNNGYIDYIQTSIRKGAKVVSRDFGPTFQMWRIRFTSSGSYSGGALQELEFRHTEGGADQPSGGSILYGSSGLGGNPTYVFDGIRGNGGYWAGEDAAISKGTSWIGYDYGVGNAFKPEEVNLTPREGSNALQLPKQGYLEGCNDGANWYPVQEFDIPDTNGSAQIPLPVLRGDIGYLHSHHPGYSVNNDGNRYTYKNYGAMFQSNVRMNISEIAVLGRFVGEEFTLTLVRYDFAETYGRITEIVEAQDVTITTALQWKAAVLTSPMEVEVGDLFGVIATTRDPSNNSGISYFIQNVFGASDSTKFIGSFYGDHVDVNLGDNSNGMGSGQYAVDFKASIF